MPINIYVSNQMVILIQNNLLVVIFLIILRLLIQNLLLKICIFLQVFLLQEYNFLL